MTDERTILWLRDPTELEQLSTRGVVLWPAVEYTVLVFGRAPQKPGYELDPFERAVVGASAANVVSVNEQAKHLDLDVQFVAHLHRHLLERGIFDSHSRPRNVDIAEAEVESHVAIHVYQDPWSGSLWPRFVPSNRRRSVPRGDADRRRILGGTTGAPIEVPVFAVPRPPRELDSPSTDDAIRAARTWIELCERHRLARTDLPHQRSMRIVADTRTEVLLCCPNERVTGARPRILDPFGGPEWSPFVRALMEEARQRTGLMRWLFDEDVRPSPKEDRTAVVEQLDPLGGLHRLEEDWDRATRRRNYRDGVRIELEAIGIAAIASLAEHSSRQPVRIDGQQSLEGLLSKIAWTVGFNEPSRWPQDLSSALDIDQGSFEHRCAALLLRFSPDQHGPLHLLAERCPDLFVLLHRDSSRRSLEALEELRDLVKALASVADGLGTHEPMMKDG